MQYSLPTNQPDAMTTNNSQNNTFASKAPTGVSMGLIVCHICGTVWQGAKDGDQCGRCETRLHQRKPNHINRTWALLIASFLMYVPANLLPIMVTKSIIGIQNSTIMGGVLYFIASGEWALAIIIFAASFLVPLFKLITLTFLLVLAEKRSAWRLKERAKLYRVVEAVGRWSMLDVFVVCILAGIVQLSNFSQVIAGPGVMAFAAVVILTMLATLSFDPRVTWDNANHQQYGQQ